MKFKEALDELKFKLNNKIKDIKEKNLSITKNQITDELLK